jgi:hypothetical protein
MNIRRAIVAKQESEEKRFESKRQIKRCEMVGINSANDPAVTGVPGYVWLKEYGLHGGVFQCFNPYVQRRVGLPVLVGADPQVPNRTVVLMADLQSLPDHPDYDGDPFLPNHGPSHEWPEFSPGPDAISVYPRSFTQLRTYAGSSGVKVSVQPYRYNLQGVVVEYTGETDIDISASVPPAGSYPAPRQWRFTLIYLDTVTNAVSIVDGTAVATSSTPTKPNCPAGGIPSAYIALDSEATVIIESVIYDARMPFEPVDSGYFGATQAAFALDHSRDIDWTLHKLGLM